MSNYFVLYRTRLEDMPIVEGEYSSLNDAIELMNEILSTYPDITDCFITELNYSKQ